MKQDAYCGQFLRNFSTYILLGDNQEDDLYVTFIFSFYLTKRCY